MFSLSLEEAKKAIKNYFEDHHGEYIDYEELADNLDISLPLIVQACAALEDEGEIASVNQAS